MILTINLLLDTVQAYFSGYGPSYVEWLGELSCNVLFQDKFSAARALQHMSQELPSPPPMELRFMQDAGQNPATETEPETAAPDLSNMGWRFCQKPIRKVFVWSGRFLHLSSVLLSQRQLLFALFRPF